MTKEICKIKYSRVKAREIYQKHHNIKLSSGVAIHHKDNDPFNNDIDNLELMLRGEHVSYHSEISEIWGKRKKIMYTAMKEKLIKLGIQNIKELMEISGRKYRICQAIWHGQRPMSLAMAKKIKKKYDIPLDYLLN